MVKFQLQNHKIAHWENGNVEFSPDILLYGQKRYTRSYKKKISRGENGEKKERKITKLLTMHGNINLYNQGLTFEYRFFKSFLLYTDSYFVQIMCYTLFQQEISILKKYKIWNKIRAVGSYFDKKRTGIN